ncbi:related to regulatory protein ral2 [Rhynchosporium secalis]|uniref:Related to regulatory protein ral2 n=1 Tax=Rhynchosporium secalis TaxID=38038 RepID=A0A1E1M632_RHYSE|nr:related to regulatory protein ral2 [Rhynchosporium secalis]
MEDKLTLGPSGAFESRFSSPDNSAEDEPGKNIFLRGVRRGIRKKLGSISGPHNRPGNIQLGERFSPASTPVTPSPIPSSTTQYNRPPRHTPNNSDSILEKPLPRTPSALPVDDPSREWPQQTSYFPEFTKPAVSMSRQAVNGSRTSTMDSAISGPGQAQMHANGSKHPSSSFQSDMGGTQGNISRQEVNRPEPEDESRDILTPRSTGPASAGPSPAQPRPSGNMVGTPGGSSQHLSGLMCNVHRTTGQEPHPLVGATTTILGDKLYVFGGRVLSRSRPVLTSDLYELDLIRRHWTKIDASGEIPPPRYFHSVCALGETKFVCYGGMSPAPSPGQAQAVNSAQDSQPEVVVMSDIYIYDAPSKTWTFIPTQDTPQGRYAHCATILPSSATFTSINAASSAIQHNLPGSNPNSGTLGVKLDGSGGAEMVVVGGQDSANHYIEQISVFNLRSLKWTSTQQLGKSCGAYRSVVAPLPANVTSQLGKTSPTKPDSGNITQDSREPGSSMLIYSNYNFLDVKLELQIRSADGTLSEEPMQGAFSPPGLRFPNGGVIDTNFVVSGTYLTSSKQEYALWALDMKTLTWNRIDAGGSVFSQGSWNRGVLWNRRNTFVILGNRKRSLVEDYNHRRINFSNVCMVELEAFGLYDNPRRAAPMSGFVSASSPFNIPSLSRSTRAGWTGGGRSLSKAAEELGQAALGMRELADMDILCVGGERIPVNSRVVARRWGPYFVQLLREGAATKDGNDAATLRPEVMLRQNPSRNSSVTITPSIGAHSSNMSTSSTLNNPSVAPGNRGSVDSTSLSLSPDAGSLTPASRPRTLYLPHTELTLKALLHFIYTSALPPSSSPHCTPQILCSLLQIARPYKVDGLLEAVVERLHEVLDSRNAAAVFNASAMAAGGGRSTSSTPGLGENWLATDLKDIPGSNPNASPQILNVGGSNSELSSRTQQSLRINTSVGGGRKSEEDDAASASGSVASDVSESDMSSSVSTSDAGQRSTHGREVWRGDVSAVIGLQKRGLRGLMEGRRLRERGASVVQMPNRVGLGIGGT